MCADSRRYHAESRAHTRMWWVLAGVVVGIALVIAAGWLFFRWIDEGMSGVHVSENPKAARHLAEGLGLQLGEGDRVVYGELQSSFPDSGSYLVVATRTRADRDRLLAASHLSCSRQDPALGAYSGKQRALDDHGPGTPATLMTCSSPVTGAGGLTASYDPTDRDGGTRVYIGAFQM